MNQITVESAGKDIIIRMPKELLVYGCENHPCIPFKVGNKRQFYKAIIKRLLDVGDKHHHDGGSDFYDLLDNLFEDIYSWEGNDAILEGKYLMQKKIIQLKNFK